MRRGFTLLECMVALLLLATASIILVQSQRQAIQMGEDAQRTDTASMLARDLMTDLEIRIEKEGFGELEVKENGTFTDERFGGRFEEYRWAWEVERVDLEIPNLSALMDMLGTAQEDSGLSGSVSDAASQADPAAILDAVGVDFELVSEELSKFLREARVRVCWSAGEDDEGQEAEECVELITHLVNPTGQVLTQEEQEALNELPGRAEGEDGNRPPDGPPPRPPR